MQSVYSAVPDDWPIDDMVFLKTKIHDLSCLWATTWVKIRTKIKKIKRIQIKNIVYDIDFVIYKRDYSSYACSLCGVMVSMLD